VKQLAHAQLFIMSSADVTLELQVEQHPSRQRLR